MGAAMARTMAKAGLDVRVWNRTRAKAEPLAADGVTVATSPAAAVRDADVVVTMLTDLRAVLDAMRAAAPGLSAGQVWLQTSTVGVAAVAELVEFAAAHDLDLVDAPVLGTRAPAEAGQLVVLGAGSERARQRVAPVTDAVGRRTVWLDTDPASAAASKLKLVLNSWVLATTTGVAEAMALAEGLGLDSGLFADTVAGTTLFSPYLKIKSDVILEGAYPADFALATAGKDADLIVAAARAAGVRLDMANAVAERFRRGVAQGLGDMDMAATFLVS
jgi:3-hydroxyisobutyrate dehydrogenase